MYIHVPMIIYTVRGPSGSVDCMPESLSGVFEKAACARVGAVLSGLHTCIAISNVLGTTLIRAHLAILFTCCHW